MSKTEKTRTDSIGLDVGTSRIVTARQVNEEIKFETQLNAIIGIPYSKMTLDVLRKEQVPHAANGGEVLVHGNEAERFADLLNKDIRRTMTRGVLNPDEPDNVRLIREITTLLTGKAVAGQKLCFTVPAAPLGAEENLTYHEATLRQILTEAGFEARTINEGLAVVYAELENTNYTGIGISCGGGLCNICFSYLSVPVISFSVPKAGDFIDASTASVTGDKPTRVRILKEQSFFLNGHVESKLQQVLTVYYEDVIQSLVSGLRSAFEGARNLPKLSRPLPIVLSGGTAMPRGFRDRFETVLRASDFPVEISEIRMAADPLTSTAKGALIAALSEM
jgi:hypothetical protein